MRWLSFSVLLLLIVGCNKDCVTSGEFTDYVHKAEVARTETELQIKEIRNVGEGSVTILESELSMLETTLIDLQTKVNALKECKCNGKCCNAPEATEDTVKPTCVPTPVAHPVFEQLRANVEEIKTKVSKLEQRNDTLLQAEVVALNKQIQELVHWANETEAFLNKRHLLKQTNCPTGNCPYANKEK